MSDLSTLIAHAVDGSFSHAEAMTVCQAEGVSIETLLNRMALTVARAFDRGDMSFDDADAAANTIYVVIIDEVVLGDDHPLPEPAFSIYVAFDEGEYQHRADEDPTEAYTRPQIRAILERESAA